MKKHFLYLITPIYILSACTHQNKTIVSNDSVKTITATPKPDNTKDISDYKMALLDGKLEKMYHLLGNPDAEGHSTDGDSKHFVYYDKVKKDGVIKHLVIFSAYNPYEDSFVPISQVEAVNDGEYVSLGRYGIIKIQKPHVKIRTEDDNNISQFNGDYKIMDDMSNQEDYNGFRLKDGLGIITLYGQTTINIKLIREPDGKYNFYFVGLNESNAYGKNWDVYSKYKPIASVNLKGIPMSFHWIGLFNETSKKLEFDSLNEVDSNLIVYLLKKL